MATADDGVSTGDDPTQAVLSESALNKKALCDYVINVATGCRHGCKFCYVPSTPVIRTRPDMLKELADVDSPQKEWGEYVLYRDDIPERIGGILDRKRTWKSTEKGAGVVGISFATDSYMDGRAGRITKEAVESLANHGRYARVLTRNPILALQDREIFKEAGEYVTIGSSIPSLNPDSVSAIEPRAPVPSQRLRGLKKFDEIGVNTFVSMSPTYPTLEFEDMKELTKSISLSNPDVVFHEPINPRSGNFTMTIEAARDAGEEELAAALERIHDQEAWFKYSLRHFAWAQKLGEMLDIPIHLWPDDLHIKLANGETEEWLSAWRNRQSIEEFGNRELPTEKPPEIPESLLEEIP